jgi:hypothetical protein
MSRLKDYRRAIKAKLVEDGVFAADQIIVDRQADEWEVIAQAFAMAGKGIVLHIAEASGTNSDPDDPDLQLSVDVVLTLFCEPVYVPSPEEGDGAMVWPEEDAWEAMVTALHGQILLPESVSGHCYEKLRLISWTHVPNDMQYYARATTFRFPLTLAVGN